MPPGVPEGQPHAIVERDGVRYTLLGTAHVSQASVDAVRSAIADGGYDAVAVELDEPRLQALTEPDALAKLDLIQVIRTGRTAMFAANLALSAYQRRLAEQLGIEPGAELKLAALQAREQGLPVHLIDREVGLTFKRASARLGFWGRAKLGGGLLGSLLVSEDVGHDEIEKLKQGDMLEASFNEFASESPEIYDTVIAERDRYMAARLREVGETSGPEIREVLAVVGAGHLQGMARHLREEQRPAAGIRESLEALPEKSGVPWFTLALATFVIGGFAWGFWQGGIDVGSDLLLQWVLATGVLGGFAWGFWQGGIDVGADLLLQWALTTGILGAIGCAIAGGHPLSILVAFLASPITPLHPALASGTLSALTEAWLRKPTYADFMALREDVQTVKGWWRNRVSRVLLNFFLTSLGTAIGVWTGGLRMLGTLFG